MHGIYSPLAYSLLAKEGRRLRIVGQSHGSLPALGRYVYSRRRVVRNVYRFIYVLERMLFTRYAHVFAVNRVEYDFFRKYHPSVKATVRPAGVDFQLFCPGDKRLARQRCELPLDQHIVLFVGRVEPVKGVDTLVAAFRLVQCRFRDALLVIVGEGSASHRLRRDAADLIAKGSLWMRGFIDNEELPDWYRAADVVVLPSRWEGCGVVGIEAMACGTPLVASYNLGTPQVVEGFECGSLVPPDDAVALANAISDVLHRREAFRPNLLKARGLFDWSVVVEERLSLYRSILGAS